MQMWGRKSTVLKWWEHAAYAYIIIYIAILQLDAPKKHRVFDDDLHPLDGKSPVFSLETPILDGNYTAFWANFPRRQCSSPARSSQSQENPPKWCSFRGLMERKYPIHRCSHQKKIWGMFHYHVWLPEGPRNWFSELIVELYLAMDWHVAQGPLSHCPHLPVLFRPYQPSAVVFTTILSSILFDGFYQ